MSKTDDNKLKCDYCGKIKEEVSFVIGYSNVIDWTLWIGTAKTSCDKPDCYHRGKFESAISTGNYKPTINEELRTPSSEKEYDYYLDVLPPLYVLYVDNNRVSGVACSEAFTHNLKGVVLTCVYQDKDKNWWKAEVNVKSFDGTYIKDTYNHCYERVVAETADCRKEVAEVNKCILEQAERFKDLK